MLELTILIYILVSMYIYQYIYIHIFPSRCAVSVSLGAIICQGDIYEAGLQGGAARINYAPSDPGQDGGRDRGQDGMQDGKLSHVNFTPLDSGKKQVERLTRVNFALADPGRNENTTRLILNPGHDIIPRDSSLYETPQSGKEISSSQSVSTSYNLSETDPTQQRQQLKPTPRKEPEMTPRNENEPKQRNESDLIPQNVHGRVRRTWRPDQHEMINSYINYVIYSLRKPEKEASTPTEVDPIEEDGKHDNLNRTIVLNRWKSLIQPGGAFHIDSRRGQEPIEEVSTHHDLLPSQKEVSSTRAGSSTSHHPTEDDDLLQSGKQISSNQRNVNSHGPTKEDESWKHVSSNQPDVTSHINTRRGQDDDDDPTKEDESWKHVSSNQPDFTFHIDNRRGQDAVRCNATLYDLLRRQNDVLSTQRDSISQVERIQRDLTSQFENIQIDLISQIESHGDSISQCAEMQRDLTSQIEIQHQLTLQFEKIQRDYYNSITTQFEIQREWGRRVIQRKEALERRDTPGNGNSRRDATGNGNSIHDTSGNGTSRRDTTTGNGTSRRDETGNGTSTRNKTVNETSRHFTNGINGASTLDVTKRIRRDASRHYPMGSDTGQQMQQLAQSQVRDSMTYTLVSPYKYIFTEHGTTGT